VGDDNIFIFGLSTPEVAPSAAAGYQPLRIYEQNPRSRPCWTPWPAPFSEEEPGRYRAWWIRCSGPTASAR
jgi:starch phosphorylase